jgi:hypothetical protein
MVTGCLEPLLSVSGDLFQSAELNEDTQYAVMVPERYVRRRRMLRYCH